MSTRWQYKVEEVKGDIWGQIKSEVLEERLQRLGTQGWELLNVIRPVVTGPIQLFLKRPA